MTNNQNPQGTKTQTHTDQSTPSNIAATQLATVASTSARQLDLKQLQTWMTRDCAAQLRQLAKHQCEVQLEFVEDTDTLEPIPTIGMVHTPSAGKPKDPHPALARWQVRSAVSYVDAIDSMEKAQVLLLDRLERMVQIAPGLVAFSKVLGKLDTQSKVTCATAFMPDFSPGVMDPSGMELVLQRLVQEPLADDFEGKRSTREWISLEEWLSVWMKLYHRELKSFNPVAGRHFVERIRKNRPDPQQQAFHFKDRDATYKGTWKYFTRNKKPMVQVKGTVYVPIACLNPCKDEDQNLSFSGPTVELHFDGVEFLFDVAAFGWDQTQWKPASIATTDAAGVFDLDDDQSDANPTPEFSPEDLVEAINARLSAELADVLADFRADGLCEVLAMQTSRPSGSRGRNAANQSNLALVFYVNSAQPVTYHAVYKGPEYPWAMCQVMESVTSMQDFERAFESVVHRLPKIRSSLLGLQNLLGSIDNYGTALTVDALLESAGGWVVDNGGMGLVAGKHVRSNYVRIWDDWTLPISGSTENYLARWCDSVATVKLESTPEPAGEFLDYLEFDEDGSWLSKWADRTIQGTWAYEVTLDKPHVVLSHRLEFGLPSLDMDVSHRVPPVATWRVKAQMVIDGVTLVGSDEALTLRMVGNLLPTAELDRSVSSGMVEEIEAEIFG